MSSGAPSRCTTQPRVSACACAGSSRGHGGPMSASTMPAPGGGPGKAGVRQHLQRAVGRRAWRYRGEQPGTHREPVVKQRDLTWRGQHRAEPAAHRGDRLGQPGLERRVRRTAAGRRRRSGRRAPGSGRRELARSGRRPAVPGDRAWRRSRLSVLASSASSPKNTASPASAFRFLMRWLPPTSVSRLRREKAGVRGEFGAERSLDPAAEHERTVDTAERPGAKCRRVRVPRRPAARGDRRMPRGPDLREQRPRRPGFPTSSASAHAQSQ